jgi:Tol biopolymer transport system component/tRNA A-37 threonylcarbamoyl transferase component Bud32
MPEITSRLSAALADRYRIEARLGEGGMATVYLAKDLKHRRKVALKVLRPELAAVLGAERFVQEITTTASLQHPHILPLFDSGTADGFLYYVMPFIDGETLRDKLNREQQLGIEDAVRIATEVADALDYAHRHGVIHRDIKPENILLHDGRPMVADFGIALAVSAAAGGRMTETGLSLGTPHYMSPEQATAEKELTARSDIYSLGSVLYETLTGEPPHTGGSAQQIIMKIVTEAPRSVTGLRRSVPANVAAAIATSLEKLPADRFDSARAFADALRDPHYTGRAGSAAQAVAATDRGTPWKWVAIAAMVVAGVLGVTTLRSWTGRRNVTGAVRELTVTLPALSRVSGATLSPTGDQVLFIGDGEIWVRSLSERTARPLPATAGAFSPFWSPDGLWIGYFVGQRVYKIAVDGATPIPVTTMDLACADLVVCGGSWTEDGRIVLSTGSSGAYEVGEDGGDAVPYLEPAEHEHFHRVIVLPGGNGALVDVDPDSGEARIDVWDGTERRTLVSGTIDFGSAPAYAEPGYVLFNRNGLRALPFSLASASATGEPFLVAQDAFMPSVSATGLLLYTVTPQTTARVVWVDHSGTVRDTVGSVQGSAFEPALSPDGERVAMRGGGTLLPTAGIEPGKIWIIDPTRGTRVPLGTGEESVRPSWSADGRRLFYDTSPPGLADNESRLVRVASPGGDPEDLVPHGYAASTSKDGRYAAFSVGDVPNMDIDYVDLRATPMEPRVFSGSPAHESSPRLSPDGRYIAYVYGGWEDGRFEVFVSAFPEAGERHQVSNGSVAWITPIRWSASGDRLYYVRASDGALMEVDLDLSGDVAMSSPRALFADPTLALERGFDVSPDGSRFLVVRLEVPHGGDAGGVILVENWLEGRRR